MGSNSVVATFEQVSKKFGDITALRRVDLKIPRGRVLALLGPNGAGKTTIVRLLLGMTRPNNGAVRVFGSDPRKASTRVRMGAMLQVAKLPETLRVREHIQLFSSYYPRPLALSESLTCAGLESVAGRLFGELSGGQKQRVLFALALCGNPDLLLLDEPTVGLDVEARHDRERQVLLLASEGMATADIATRIGLSEGTVRNYLSEAISKVGASNRVEAARIAREKGWL